MKIIREWMLEKVMIMRIIILLFCDRIVMKDSYIRSKVELKPLNNSDFRYKKSSVVDYDQY